MVEVKTGIPRFIFPREKINEMLEAIAVMEEILEKAYPITQERRTLFHALDGAWKTAYPDFEKDVKIILDLAKTGV